MIFVYSVVGSNLIYIGVTDSDTNAKTLMESHFRSLNDAALLAKYVAIPMVSANWYDVANNVSIAPSDVQDIIASNQ